LSVRITLSGNNTLNESCRLVTRKDSCRLPGSLARVLLLMRQLLEVGSGAVQQIAQHGHLGGDAGVQRGVHVGREERRVVRGQRGSRSYGLRKLLRIGSAQAEVETGNALVDEIRKIFRSRVRLLR